MAFTQNSIDFVRFCPITLGETFDAAKIGLILDKKWTKISPYRTKIEQKLTESRPKLDQYGTYKTEIELY